MRLDCGIEKPRAYRRFLCVRGRGRRNKNCRTAFEQDGELSAGSELRRLFPGITDGAKAREMARVIAGWKPRRSSIEGVRAGGSIRP
jgi:hypothetical protein